MDDSESSPSPLDAPRTRRDPDQARRHRSSKDRERLFMGGSTREFARLLVYQERDAKDLRKMLSAVTEQLKGETQRADAAENKAREAALRFKAVNDAKVAAQQEAARVNEELRLYKLQLDNAQREIHRAQELLDAVEAQRLEAEEAAARARTTARRLKEEKVVQLAREEGRRVGLEEGMARGRSIGFEEGRTEGYARGLAAAERARRDYEDVEETPDEEPNRDNDRRSGPSGSSPDDFDSRPASAYTQTLGRDLGISSANHLSKDRDVHPTVIRNATPSPSHPPVDFPPDGWIPQVDDDKRIRLPPPHELGPPLPTPSPPPSLVLQNAQEPTDDRPPLFIPPPADRADSALSDSDSTTMTTPTHRRPRPRRRGSSESQSTTMSQFEILGPPVPSTRAVGRERQSVLSAIAEERERSSSRSSPVPGASESPYAPSSGSTFYMPLNRPSPQVPSADVGGLGPMASHQNIYMRPRSPNSSPDSGRVAAPAPPLRPPSQSGRSRRSSLSPDYNITVEPPSRPESDQSRSVPMTPHLLSAEDIPLPSHNGATTTADSTPQQSATIPPPSSGPVPVILPDGQLPFGFQPIGPPIPLGSYTPVPTVQSPVGMAHQGMHTNLVSPTGVPLPPSSYAGTPSVVGSAMIPGTFPTSENVVIPQLSSNHSGQAVLPRSRVYTRSALKDSSSDSDSVVSSRLSDSLDSLTTPPARHRQTPSQTTPAYAIAPIPPNIVYPAPIPSTPRSMSSRGTAAVRVPLPPSATASIASPGSTVTHPYGQTPYNRSNLALDAGRTPAALSRPISPLMGSAQGTQSSLPLPIPMQQVEYRNPHEDESLRPSSAANSGPVRPPSSASRASVAETSTTSKSKKSKKSKKAKSKITSVEEVADEE
ncbi:hypothetical protein AcV7_002816 [Taiwanofungus camphoratus]|nr:hypothetical protein AcV7_002816 [Antrodia cinnamomea]